MSTSYCWRFGETEETKQIKNAIWKEMQKKLGLPQMETIFNN